MSFAVGIVMPTRNVAQWVKPAIKSVRDQTDHKWRLVVVDDASADGTRREIRAACGRAGRQSPTQRIDIIRVDSPVGIPGAVARGMAALDALADPPDWVMCCAGDDLLSIGFVRAALERVEVRARMQAALVCLYPRVCEFGLHDCRWVSDYEPGVLRDRNIIPGCAVWRRDVWRQLGGFDGRFLHGLEDWYLAARAETAGVFRHPHEPEVMPKGAVYYHRARRGSLTETMTPEYAAWAAREVAALYPPPDPPSTRIVTPADAPPVVQTFDESAFMDILRHADRAHHVGR